MDHTDNSKLLCTPFGDAEGNFHRPEAATRWFLANRRARYRSTYICSRYHRVMERAEYRGIY